MIKFLVVGQQLKIATPIVVADSHNYQECAAEFIGSEWENVYKWAHFTKDDTTYDVVMHNDRIVKSQSLDLLEGTWQVYLTGTDYSPNTVDLSTLEWAYVNPYWQASLDPCATLLSITSYTIDDVDNVIAGTTANTIAADDNVLYVYNGSSSIEPSGTLYYNESASAVTRITTSVSLLKVESTGSSSPFPAITPSYSEVLAAEIEEALNVAHSVRDDADSGNLDGATFTPYVSASGMISWTNDRGRENPEPTNIRGPQGPVGPKGDTGNAGYTPTASAERNEDDDGVTVTITDAFGTTTVDILDGPGDVYVGPEEPEYALIWIDTDGDASALDADDIAYDSSETYADGTAGKAIADKIGEAPLDGKQYARKNGAWAEVVTGQGGSSDYSDLVNKPKINSHELVGNQSASDLGLAPSSHNHTKTDITDLPTIPTALSQLADDSTHRTVTDAEKSTWDAKGTYSKPSGGIPDSDLESTFLKSSDITGKEDSTNKVTSISSSSTDTEYPSAKCVYSIVGDIESALAALR